MRNIKVGDTVQLKSGGPIMTVHDVERATIHCVWFNSITGLYAGQDLLPSCLVQVETPVNPHGMIA